MTLTEAFVSRAGDDRPGCTVEGRTIPWTRVVSESIARSEILANFLDPSRTRTFAILVDDYAELSYWMGGALLSGASFSALDPVRHSPVHRSILQSADNQYVIADDVGLRHLDELGLVDRRVLALSSLLHLVAFDNVSKSLPLADEPRREQSCFSLVVDTSVSQSMTVDVTIDQVSVAAQQIIRSTEMTSHDICYDTMPMGSANSVLAVWAPAVMVGAEIMHRRAFSPARFLEDVFDYNCTYFTFDGSMIADILDQPRSKRDQGNRLRVGVGTGSNPQERHEFHSRFGCELIDAGPWNECNVKRA